MNRSLEASSARPTRGSIPNIRARSTIQPNGWALVVAAASMLLSVALRLPTVYYTGLPEQREFNNYIFQFLGAYSDITSLYFRDQLWNHPLPYFEYAVEYPVGMALLIWLVGFFNSNVLVYFGATAAVMIAAGLVTMWLARYFEGANPWLLALSPTLLLYTVLNWDMLSVLLTVAALLLFRCDRDAWGGLALAAAVWTKFFPIVIVPLVLLDRVMKRRWRDAFVIGAVFGVASIMINAPFAIESTTDGWGLRRSWLFFFEFNQLRNREVNFWNFFDILQLSTPQINQLSAILLLLGVGGIMALMWRGRMNALARGRDLLLPASLAAIGWFFWINKVYSPQYSLWLAVLLALLAAPPALAVLFAAADVGYFAVSFILLYLATSQNPATTWFFAQVMLPATALREAAIALLIMWACWRIVRRDQPIGREQQT